MNEKNLRHAFEDELFFTLRQQRNNWVKIALGSMIATLLSLLGLIVILPHSGPQPFVIMVDKTTGDAEKLVQVRPASLDQQDAVLQAELVSYVTDRETYDQSDNATRIPDVLLRSSGPAAESLQKLWSSTSSDYPPKLYGDGVRIRVVVNSVSVIPSAGGKAGSVARVRITKFREESGQKTAQRVFAVTVGYAFEPKQNATLGEVWKNPLGFMVNTYRIDAETAE
ncbi:MAG TPA: type IV secretion system protein [Nitrospira sp.]|nr:type IV secretion system protein [Nitrospira sp.]